MIALHRTAVEPPLVRLVGQRSTALAGDWWNSRTFFVLAMLLSMVPLLVATVPPLVDLPGHIGRYRVMLGSDSATLDQWYVFRWHLVGNLGVDLLVRLLAPLLGLEAATRLVVLAIPPLTVAGMLGIARAVHGRVQPTALFALPLAYSFPLQFGFVNFALAMALALNGAAWWIRLGRQDRIVLRAAVFVPLSLAVWLCHVMGWGLLALLVFAAEWVRVRDRRGGWVRALPDACLACWPVAGPILLQLAWRSGNGAGVTEGFGRLDLKASWLAMVLRDRWMPFDIAATAVLYLLLYKGLRDPRIRFSRDLTIATLVVLAAFVAIPGTIYGSAYADMRLAPYVTMLGLLALRPVKEVNARETALLALAGLALFGVRLAGNTASFWLYDRSYRRELAALDYVPHGARLATFVGRPCADPWFKSRLEHLPGLALARRSAFANDQWLLAGAPLLTVHGPGGPDFATDPSQQVLRDPCPVDPAIRTIDQALRTLPHDQFDYLWLIDPPPFDRQLLGNARQVWKEGNSGLYRVEDAKPVQ